MNNKGADQPAPLLFAHILRRVFSATLTIDQAQVALHLYGQLFNGVLKYTHIETLGLLLCSDEYEIE